MTVEKAYSFVKITVTELYTVLLILIALWTSLKNIIINILLHKHGRLCWSERKGIELEARRKQI